MVPGKAPRASPDRYRLAAEIIAHSTKAVLYKSGASQKDESDLMCGELSVLRRRNKAGGVAFKPYRLI
jgi:hypothetical protein